MKMRSWMCTAGCLAGLLGAAPLRAEGLFSGNDFRAHEDNHFLAQRSVNKGWAGRDDAAWRGHYSLKFTVFGEPLAEKEPGRTEADRLEWFLSYTGEFDFYWGTRPSSPVVNRISNPGVHLRVPLQRLGLSTHWRDNLSIGLEHRSNGQVTEVSLPREAERAQAAYDRQDREFFDKVSRGANYVSLTLNLETAVDRFPALATPHEH